MEIVGIFLKYAEPGLSRLVTKMQLERKQNQRGCVCKLRKTYHVGRRHLGRRRYVWSKVIRNWLRTNGGRNTVGRTGRLPLELVIVGTEPLHGSLLTILAVLGPVLHLDVGHGVQQGAGHGIDLASRLLSLLWSVFIVRILHLM